MAMSASNSEYSAGRLDELQRENEELRERLRQLSTTDVVARGAISQATTERETTARLAHQVAVEERATRAAVEVQGSSISFAVVMQVINFFLLVVLMIGVFAWIPREMENRLRPATTVVSPVPGATVVR